MCVCVCVCVCIYQFESHLTIRWIKEKGKVLKTHLFCKIFSFLYRSLVSLIKSKETSNKN